MKRLEVKPVIGVSKCLNFAECRYNGQGDKNDFVTKLHNYVDFIPFCPEVEIGMPIPRDPIRLVNKSDKIHVIQPSTNADYTDKMQSYTETLHDRFSDVDGFILKTRSPSCGIKDVKIYEGTNKSSSFRKGKGFIGEYLTSKYNYLAIEDDGRLRNYNIRHHFLTKLYVMTYFNNVASNYNKNVLVTFHNTNSLLMTAYNKTQYNLLCRLIRAATDNYDENYLTQYRNTLGKIFRIAPRINSNINVLKLSLDKFYAIISDDERNFINDMIDQYANHKLPFSTPLNIIKGYVIRFGLEDMKNQSFFEPYPKELMDVNDSGKGVK